MNFNRNVFFSQCERFLIDKCVQTTCHKKRMQQKTLEQNHQTKGEIKKIGF